MEAVLPDRAVIFDLDGTLVDTAPDLMRATNFVLTGMGRRALEMPEVRAFVGHGARALLTRGLAATGGLPDVYDVEADYRRFVDFYSANIAQDSAPFPGIVGLLERLKEEGFGLGVCTNKLEGLSVQLLDALDLSKYFGSVIGPDTLGVAKPDPKPFYEAVSRLDLDNPRALMVGDSETDILTARNAGVPVIAVPFGYTPRPVEEFGPDRMIGHFDEAYDAIQELFAEA